MQSYYEINVALNGKHLFTTSLRSYTTESEYEKVLNIIKEKFPKSEGYVVSATHWNCSGKILYTNK